MTWFAVDDSLHGHPKLADLESGGRFAEALALWTVAGSWCASHLTDGLVPAPQLRKLVPFAATKAASELVRVGLWEAVNGGYQFRDWTHYQPTKEEVESRRLKGAARTRKSREQAKARVSTSVTSANGNAACNAVTDRVTDVERALSETLSRPVPSPSLSDERDTRAPEAPRHLARFADSLTPTPNPIADLALRFSDARHAAGFGRWRWDGRSYGPDFERLQRIDAALGDETELGYDAALDAALRGFFADPKARDVKCPIAWLANDVGGYVAAGRKVATAGSLADLEAEAAAAREDYQTRLGEDGDRERKERLDAARQRLARARSAA